MVRMKNVLCLLLAVFFSFAVQAQRFFNEEGPEQDSLPEVISILNPNQDPRLTRMVQWQIENNRRKNGIDGWRVEIFNRSGSNALEEALEVKQDFLSVYPDIPVNVLFNAPDFKVRVGDFRTRNEALKLRKEITKKYPKSFAVRDKINFPPLRKKESRNE